MKERKRAENKKERERERDYAVTIAMQSRAERCGRRGLSFLCLFRDTRFFFFLNKISHAILGKYDLCISRMCSCLSCRFQISGDKFDSIRYDSEVWKKDDIFFLVF